MFLKPKVLSSASSTTWFWHAFSNATFAANLYRNSQWEGGEKQCPDMIWMHSTSFHSSFADLFVVGGSAELHCITIIASIHA